MIPTSKRYVSVAHLSLICYAPQVWTQPSLMPLCCVQVPAIPAISNTFEKKERPSSPSHIPCKRLPQP